MDELELDHNFWGGISTSRNFFEWLVLGTKFSNRPLRLVTEERWHQCSYKAPETKRESETDILLILVDKENGERIALHVENKPPHGNWRPKPARKLSEKG